MSAPLKTLENTGQTGTFPKNSAKVHSGPDNQRQSQNAANPRGSPHCGLPRTALAQKSANAFLLLLPSSSAEPRTSPKIRPKAVRNPPPGQGCCPPPKEATQRLTGANTGVLRPVPPVSAGRGDVQRPSPRGAVGVDCAAPVPAPPAGSCRAGNRSACVRLSA